MLFGFIIKVDFILDSGVLLSVLSFLFVNRGRLHTFSFFVLLVIVSVFFLFMFVWFYSKHVLYYQEIQRGSEKAMVSSTPTVLREISSNLIVGALLSVFASLMGIYSSLGIERVEFLQMVIYSTIVFFIFILVIVLLSKEGN